MIKEINNLKEKIPCPVSATVFNGAIFRSNNLHNHLALTRVGLESKKAQRKEKELVANSRRPISQRRGDEC